MASTEIITPFQTFRDVDGTPLDAGYLYIGVNNLEPIANPLTVYWDAGLTIPAAQPIRTIGGYPSRAGSPAKVFVDSDYSMTIKDSSGQLVASYLSNVNSLSNTSDVKLGDALIGVKTTITNGVGRSQHSKNAETVSIMDFGAACDGVTDDTAKIQAAINGIASGYYTLIIPYSTKISSDLTFGANTELLFLNNGNIIGDAGTEVVTIQRQINAGLHPIFNNCAPIAATGMIIHPEWFGATKDGTTDDKVAFTKAFDFLQNVGGVVQMQAGTYYLNTQLTLNRHRIALQGAGMNITYLAVNNGATSALAVAGVDGTPVANATLRDFSIKNTAVAGGVSNIGLDLSYTAFCYVERMQIHDFLTGVQMLRATNSQITKVGATYTSGATNGFKGFNILGGGTSTGGNASSILTDCWASGKAGLTGQIGFRASGAYMSDLQLVNPETAVTNYGIYLDYTTAPDYNEDIIITKPILDRWTAQGILVDSLPANGSLTIGAGGWLNPATTGAETDGIYLSNCVGLTRISDLQFVADTNYANAYGIRLLSSTGYKIAGCTFKDQKYGVFGASGGYGSVADCLFKNANGRTATQMIHLTGDARTMINGCTFNGYATEGVNIDNTSSGTGILNCSANVTNITTRFTNNAAGAVGGANGSTGNNSGY